MVHYQFNTVVNGCTFGAVNMNPAFTSIATNLGLGIDFIIWIALTLGFLIFFAKDFKLGVLITFIGEAVIFMWYFTLYQGGYDFNYYYPLIVMFLSLIVLTLSLLFVGGVADKSGGYV